MKAFLFGDSLSERHRPGSSLSGILNHVGRSEVVKAEDKRRTDRVVITVPIEVSGRDITGREFSEQTRTLVVSAQGANIVLTRMLDVGQRVAIGRVGSSRKADARIVGRIGGQPDDFVYGVCLLEPNVNLWGIGFPPLAEADRAVVRLLLECSVCLAREVVYLDELQSEVYEASQGLSRSCKQCADWTFWKQVPLEPLRQQLPGVIASGALPSRARRIQERRKDVRVGLKIPACIRQPGFGEEIVTVQNVSRGGFSFLSPKRYLEGSALDVAISYSPGAANIFVPARIVRSQEVSAEGLRKYGVRYGVTRLASAQAVD